MITENTLIKITYNKTRFWLTYLKTRNNYLEVFLVLSISKLQENLFEKIPVCLLSENFL